MNLIEIDRALRKLRLSGMAEHLELRILEAQTNRLAPLDFLATLVSDELQRRGDRLIERRIKRARFRDPDKTLDVGSSRVDLQACKLEYSIVSPK